MKKQHVALEVNTIGRILLIEFNEHNFSVFEEIVRILEHSSDFEKLQLSDESVLSVPMIDIHLKQRKVFLEHNEIELTKKEYDLLCLLVTNRGIVVTYEQMYKKFWDESEFVDVINTVGCHVRSLRRKLFKAVPNAVFDIRCVRSVGYCFEIKSC